MNKALEKLVEIITEENEDKGLHFVANETLKNNDTVLHSIHVIRDEAPVGVAIYVDDILKEYVTGMIGGRQAAKMFLERIPKSGGMITSMRTKRKSLLKRFCAIRTRFLKMCTLQLSILVGTRNYSKAHHTNHFLTLQLFMRFTITTIV